MIRALCPSLPPISRILIPGLLALVLPAGLAAQGEDLNRIILRVNDEIFTLHDYERIKADQIAQIVAMNKGSAEERQRLLSNAGKQILKQNFEDLLLRSRAKQIGVRVDEIELQESLAEFREQNGFASQAEMNEALERAQMNRDAFEEQMRRRLLMQKVVGREVWGEIKIGDEELRAYYRNNEDEFRQPEKRHLREVIVLESSGRSDEELQTLGRSLLSELQAGAELQALVSSRSEEGLTTGVIDLGWLRQGELEKTLADAAWSLEVGDYSQPVKARGGYHIVQLVEVEAATLTPFEEVENQIRARERGLRFNKELRSYMVELEKGAYVREDLPLEAVGYRSALDGFEEEQEFDFFAETGALGEAPEAGGS